MKQLNTRSTPMSDEEWVQYCKKRRAIVHTDRYACLSDGFTYDYEPENQ